MKTMQMPKQLLKELPEIEGKISRMEYVRIGNTNIGVILRTVDGNCGWSLCNKKDKWDKCKGIRIAYNRSKKGLNEMVVFYQFPEKYIMGERMNMFASIFECVITEWDMRE